MIRSILIPLRTSSTNVMLGANVWAIRASRAKNERGFVTRCLGDARFGPPPMQSTVARGVTVTLCRVSSGVLDFDNAVGSQKSVRDAVAAWLGRDDRDPVVSWRYEQQKCERGYMGVRITIADECPGPLVDLVLGVGPKRLGPPSESGEGHLPPKFEDPTGARVTRRTIAARAPVALPRVYPVVVAAGAYGANGDVSRPFHGQQSRGQLEIQLPAWSCDPWNQTGDGLPELTELALPLGVEPPRRITRPVPPMVRHLHAHAKNAITRLCARTVVLYRHEVEHPELGRALVYAERGCAELDYFARGSEAAQ